MLYFLYPLSDHWIVFNLFRYITFRAACASVLSFFFCLWMGPPIIRWLTSIKIMNHAEREHAEKLHELYKHKKDTPTMGGILIVASVLGTMAVCGNLTDKYVWILLLAIAGFGAIGFLDDWIKLKTRSSRGISSMTKMGGQIFLGFVLGAFLYGDAGFDKWLYFPFLKNSVVYLGVWYIPFIILVLTGSSNALNLTDGLDGLAIGCTLFTTVSLAIISYVVGRVDFAQYLSLPYIAQGGEIAVFCAALIGASAGFLWYNCYPSQVMMGDTGSLALGGALGMISVLVKKELVLVILGGVFVLEAISVILQVASFKLTRKRIFLMSPFHHHLQLKGWPESKVTVRLWIVSMILAVVGLLTLKVR